MFGRHRVDALHGRQDAQLLPVLAHLQVLLLHVRPGVLEHETRNLEVREAHALGLAQHLGRKALQSVVSFQRLLHVHDVLQLADEPWVYLGQLIDALYRVALFQGLCHGEDAQVRGVRQLVVQLVEMHMVVAHKAVHPLAYHAQALLDDFLERTADGHDFAHRLHAGTDVARHALELRQVPARYLADEVVQRRSHVSRVRRSHLANLVEGVAQGNLGGHESQRVAGGLGSQGRRTAQAGVHLDDAVVVRLGVKGILNVALAHDAQMPDAGLGQVLQHLHLVVAK